MKEAQILIETWRAEYNALLPQSTAHASTRRWE
jgi:hypothetical protein